MKINVEHIAKLAALTLSDYEIDKFCQQLSSILNYIKILQKCDVSQVEQTIQITTLQNITRSDTETTCLSQQDATGSSTKIYNGLFEIKGILET